MDKIFTTADCLITRDLFQPEEENHKQAQTYLNPFDEPDGFDFINSLLQDSYSSDSELYEKQDSTTNHENDSIHPSNNA